MENRAIDALERFDMVIPPKRQSVFLRPLVWLLSFPSVWAHRVKIDRVNTRDLKPPYLLLCSHNSFMDFKVTTAAVFPARANYVVAIDGFIGREWLLRNVGCVCKRKFTNDIMLIRHLKRVVNHGDIAVLYPEARYSLCGTTAVLPDSVGKLAKILGVPVVTLIMHGHHINSPFWHLGDRGVRTQATFTQLFTAEEVKRLPHDVIFNAVEKAFQYDDFAWQKQNGVRIACPDRAEGLHKVLYQCPHCGVEYRMSSSGDGLRCEACGKRWIMGELGDLQAAEGKTEFCHIPDWYEWERAQVRAEIDAGRYSFRCRARVDSLPSARGFVPLGEAELIHDRDGFRLSGSYNGQPYEIQKPVSSMYSCHIEYEYLGVHGDCIDLSTLTDTFYIYPKDCVFSVTKISLATEELYKAHMAQQNLSASVG